MLNVPNHVTLTPFTRLCHTLYQTLSHLVPDHANTLYQYTAFNEFKLSKSTTLKLCKIHFFFFLRLKLIQQLLFYTLYQHVCDYLMYIVMQYKSLFDEIFKKEWKSEKLTSVIKLSSWNYLVRLDLKGKGKCRN